MAIAFPGAEGHGAATQGARAGGSITVYRVTNLNDSGSGSFRAAAEASGARIIVFTVGGTIVCDGSVEITNPYCTILGQTAPGDGITLTRPSSRDDQPLMIMASEVILRYIRIRAGEHKSAPSTGGDCLRIGTKDRTVENVIVDHVTCSWGTDETIDVYQPCENVTVQWTLIDHAIMHGSHTEYDPRGHGKGIIFGPGCNKYSMHHCIVSHCMSRAPRTKTKFTTPNEQVANVIYNTTWEDGQWGPVHIRSEYGTSTQKVNITNNTIKIGPDRATTKGYMIDIAIKDGGSPQVYHTGCRVLETDGTDVTDTGGRDIVRPGKTGYVVGTAHTMGHSYPVTTTSASVDYDLVLDGAGCTIPKRDSLDRATINEIRTGTGSRIQEDQSEVGGLPTLDAGTPYTDSDSDGLPDYYEYEISGETSTTSTNPVTINGDGYTHIEAWSHTLSSDTTSDPGGGGGSGGGGTEPPTGDVTDPITSGSNDCTQTTGAAFTSTGTRCLVGHYSASEYNAWSAFRFTDINVLNSSTLDSAYLRFYVTGVNTAAPTIRCYAFDEDDSAALNSETDVDTRHGTLTTAYVEFTPSSSLDNQWTATPDISSVIEEVVARAGWVIGNDLTLVLQPEPATWSSQERIKIMAYDGDPGLAATLELNAAAVPTGESDSGTVDQQISASGNDGYMKGEDSSLNTVNNRIYCGHTTSATGYEGWWLFTSLGIEQGATIDTAYIKGDPGSQAGSSFDLRIMAADEDDAAVPSTFTDGDTRTRTTAYVDWTFSGSAGTRYDSPSLVTVIQEVVDRAGWTNTSNILLFCRNQDHDYAGDDIDERVGWKSYDDGPTDAVELYVEWSKVTAVPVGPALKILNVGMDAGMNIGIS